MRIEIELNDFDDIVQRLSEISTNVDPMMLLSTVIFVVDEVAGGIRAIYLDEDPSNTKTRVGDAVFDLVHTLMIENAPRRARRPSQEDLDKLFDICEELVKEVIDQLSSYTNWLHMRISLKEIYGNPRIMRRVSLSLRALPLGDAAPAVDDQSLGRGTVDRFISSVIRP